MNEEQTSHLNTILETSHRLIKDKYTKGSKEHNSILNKDYTSSQLLDMAIEEAIDQITYLLTLKEKENES